MEEPLTTMDDFYDTTTLINDIFNISTTVRSRSFTRDYYRYVGDMIRAWGPVAIIPFGFIGNIFSFLVFNRPKMRGSITAFYFRWLAVFDTLHLAIEVLPQGLQTISGKDMTRTADWWCKTRYFFAYITRNLAVWTLVLVTIERLLAVVIPHKANVLITKSRAAIVLTVTSVILLGLTLPVGWLIKKGPLYSSSSGRLIGYRCFLRGTEDLKKFAEEAWPWIDFWIYSGAPFCIMLTSNAAIILTVVLSNIRRRQTTNQDSTRTSSHTLNMTAMLVSVSFTFIVLTAPTCSYWIGTKASNLVYSGKIRMWFATSKFLAYLNHAINFEIYCLSGRKFRDELKKMLGMKVESSSMATYACSGTKNTNIATVSGSQNEGYSVTA